VPATPGVGLFCHFYALQFWTVLGSFYHRMVSFRDTHFSSGCARDWIFCFAAATLPTPPPHLRPTLRRRRATYITALQQRLYAAFGSTFVIPLVVRPQTQHAHDWLCHEPPFPGLPQTIGFPPRSHWTITPSCQPPRVLTRISRYNTAITTTTAVARTPLPWFCSTRRAMPGYATSVRIPLWYRKHSTPA